ncbi:hypothetical protein Tco_0344380 [Tanacetum coccineum]
MFHSKTKHIEIRHHFIRDAYEKKLIHVLKIHSDDNVADLLTKAFDVSRFYFLIFVLPVLVNTGRQKVSTARPKLSTARQKPCDITVSFNVDTKTHVKEVKVQINPLKTPPAPSSILLHPKSMETKPHAPERDQVQLSHDSPLSGGHTSDKAEGGLNLDELLVLCTNLSNRVLALETSKDAQATKILKLKTRIKKLEKNAFDDLDVDLAYGMDDMETEEVVNEGRQSNKTKELNLDVDVEVIAEDKGSSEKGGSIVSTARPDVGNARQEIGTPDPTTPLTTTTIFDDEEMTVADTLVKMKDNKAKGVVFKDTKELVRPVRSVLTLKPLLSIDPKDKGKGVLEEPKPAKKMTRSDFDAAQVARDAEVARQLEVELQAEVEKERQREEQASMDYIANLYDEALYIKEQERAANFVPIGSEEDERFIQKMNKKAASVHVEKVLEEPDSTKVEVKQEEAEQGTEKTPGKVLKIKARKKARKPTHADSDNEHKSEKDEKNKKCMGRKTLRTAPCFKRR